MKIEGSYKIPTQLCRLCEHVRKKARMIYSRNLKLYKFPEFSLKKKNSCIKGKSFWVLSRDAI